jgi:hypothetical protein
MLTIHWLLTLYIRNKLIKCVAQYNVPAKLIRIIVLTIINTRAGVKVNNEYTEEFKLESGEKQRYPLSTTSFSVAVDVILKQLDLRVIISKRLRHCSAYADDILITTSTKQSLNDDFKKLKNQSILLY